MLKRPTQEDTEDDLLRQQQEFLKSKSRPAAQVVRLGEKRKSPKAGSQATSTDDELPSAPKHVVTERDMVSLGDLPANFPHTSASTSVQKKPGAKTKPPEYKVQAMDIEDPEESLEKHDHHITNVLREIVEKEHAFPVYYPAAVTSGGFPKVLHRGADDETADFDTTNEGTKKKKKSLFARHFSRQSPQDFGLPPGYKRNKQPSTSSVSQQTSNRTPLSAQVLERSLPTTAIQYGDHNLGPGTSGEGSRIHQENIAKLSSMTEDEILVEQKKLLETLDPSVVAFLKSRGKPKQATESDSRQPTSSSNTSSGADSLGGGSDSRKVSQMETSETTDKNTVNISELPVKPDKDWLHMDKVESDKLSWMKDLPTPEAGDTKTGKSARFDFEGRLVGPEADLPTHLGLHHHGEEPERAGYTLQELFHLARSAHLQQRVLSLNTLAKIIHHAKRGLFHECVSTGLIPALVDGGLFFILRWALDDSMDNSMAAAVNCLHALLVTEEEEEALDRVFSWYCGHDVPFLCPPASTAPSDDDNANQDMPKDENTKDADVLKQDIIKGLLKMSLLPRLRYILEIWRPTATVVIQILDILIRVARHSPESAYQISICPRLMETIFREFLPWQLPEKWVEPLTSAYGYPCSRALKLIRLMCAAGRNLASTIMSHHPLMERIILYISQNTTSNNSSESHQLIVESFRTWRILVAYGMTLIHYSEYYSILMDMLQASCRIPPGSDTSATCVSHTASLMSHLEAVVHAAANATAQASQHMAHRERTSHNMPEELEHTVTSPGLIDFNWSHVTGLFGPVHLCLQNGLEHFIKNYINKKYDLSLLASCLNFTASWLSRSENMPGYDAVEHLNLLSELSESFLIPVLESQAFSDTLNQLRQCSVLLSSESPKRTETLTNLPDLGFFIGNSALKCPLLESNSPVHFVLAFVRVLSAMKKHTTIHDKVCGLLLEHEELLQYIRRLCKTKHSAMAPNHFAQFECHLQEILLLMVKQKRETPSVALYHQMSLFLLTHFTEGSELSVHRLLSTVIFNKDFVRDLENDGSSSSLDEKLTLQDHQDLSSATQQLVPVDRRRLLDQTLETLSSVRNTYMTAFSGFEKALHKSRSRHDEMSSVPDSIGLGHCGQLLVPLDWIFLPLVEVYNRTTALSGSTGVEESVSPELVSTVTNTLRCVHLMETCRSGTLDNVGASVKLSRIVCTFLAGSDLFLDSGVQSCLAALLRVYCKPVQLDRMEFNKPIPGLASFYDLYIMLLEQYSAVSFGDSVFGCYLLLPLQQKHSSMFRKAVWGEHVSVLRALFIPIAEVPIPLQRFLEPEETNLELIRLYFEALFKRLVSPQFCPLFYLIAVHHVNRFFYTQDSKHGKLRRAMIKQILKVPNQALKHHLLYYKTAESTAELGMILYDNLPNNRQQLLKNVEENK